jgi:hypothetical protein
MLLEWLLESLPILGTASLIYGLIGLRAFHAPPADFAGSVFAPAANAAPPAWECGAVESLSHRRRTLGRVRRKAPPEEGDASPRSIRYIPTFIERGGTSPLWNNALRLRHRPVSPGFVARSLSSCWRDSR